MVDNKITTGIIYEEEWREILNYLYNESDSSTVNLKLKKLAQTNKDDNPQNIIITMGQAIDNNSKDSSHFSYDKQNMRDVKRLGYSSSTLKIDLKDNNYNKIKKNSLKLPFSVFMKTVLGNNNCTIIFHQFKICYNKF
jgi:hypothetical protein